MGKNSPPEEPTGDIPEWFMTYSDVITLLMTFFILLLTFASNEPEQFERMQSSMFSQSGGTGVAGKRDDGMERESFVVRSRPRSARMTMRGSEVPPIVTDPNVENISQSLAGLEDDELRNLTPRSSIQIPLSLFLNADQSETSAVGTQHLKMLTRQVRRPGYHLALAIHPLDDAGPIVVIIQALVKLGLDPWQMALTTSQSIKAGSGLIRLEVIREERGDNG